MTLSDKIKKLQEEKQLEVLEQRRQEKIKEENKEKEAKLIIDKYRDKIEEIVLNTIKSGKAEWFKISGDERRILSRSKAFSSLMYEMNSHKVTLFLVKYISSSNGYKDNLHIGEIAAKRGWVPTNGEETEHYYGDDVPGKQEYSRRSPSYSSVAHWDVG